MSTAAELSAVAAVRSAGGTARDGRFLIAGSGSIGRRHLENLRLAGATRLELFRSGRRDPAAPVPDAPEEFDLATALGRRPRAILVCNPSAHHLELALAAARAGIHVFVEKPLSHRIEGTEELLRVVEERRLVGLVGFQYRFHPALRQVKRWLDDGAIGEIVANVALNVFTNYFNSVTRPQVDFPAVKPRVEAVAA